MAVFAKDILQKSYNKAGHEKSPAVWLSDEFKISASPDAAIDPGQNPCLTLASVSHSWKGSRNKFTPAKLLSAPLLAQKAEAS
jgi:hypothetical protein